MKNFKLLLGLVVLAMLAGCISGGPVSNLLEQVEESEAKENEFKVVCINAVTDTPILNAEADIKKAEFPRDFDTSTLSADQFFELTKCPER